MDGAGTGEGARIAEDEVTAADNRQAGIRARAREERGGVTRTDKVQVTGDRTAEGALAEGREVDERAEGVREGAGLAGLLVGAAEFVDQLRLITQIDDRVEAFDAQAHRGGAAGVGEDGERVSRTRVQVHAALVDRKAIGGTEVGRRVEVE